MAVNTDHHRHQGNDLRFLRRIIEDALSSLVGVYSAVVNLATEKAVVRYDPEQVTLAAMKAAISRSRLRGHRRGGRGHRAGRSGEGATEAVLPVGVLALLEHSDHAADVRL